MTNIPHTYREMTISSALMEVPREAYQRNFNVNRAKKIAEEFDERIANEPKVSFRDGRYFVFDGQHTVAARKFLNGGDDLPGGLLPDSDGDMLCGTDLIDLGELTGNTDNAVGAVDLLNDDLKNKGNGFNGTLA